MSGFRDDAPPWSFFIPVTLAVIVGVLAADAIRYAVKTVLADDSAERADLPRPSPPIEPAERTPQPAPMAEMPAGAAVAEAPGAEMEESGDATEDAPVGPTVPGAGQNPPDEAGAMPAVQPSAPDQLPGPLSARRDEAEAACINGTVAYRSGNGWEQALENDAPVRCTASSP
ncbi:hypothetical protein QFW77_10900 [Luteimonas sp. RD2P54]|uniref:Lectin-like protein BA14k n=1 Tax=Luteimonas endophytica TaxID=3042023 RepID=A0ABT6JBE1_9GAMM|nr:hypothetical protein [Luteimonas endophytica]MDH5823493.1 hypothetical protein [Luteimonas endophytica]